MRSLAVVLVLCLAVGAFARSADLKEIARELAQILEFRGQGQGPGPCTVGDEKPDDCTGDTCTCECQLVTLEDEEGNPKLDADGNEIQRPEWEDKNGGECPECRDGMKYPRDCENDNSCTCDCTGGQWVAVGDGECPEENEHGGRKPGGKSGGGKSSGSGGSSSTGGGTVTRRAKQILRQMENTVEGPDDEEHCVEFAFQDADAKVVSLGPPDQEEDDDPLERGRPGKGGEGGSRGGSSSRGGRSGERRENDGHDAALFFWVRAIYYNMLGNSGFSVTVEAADLLCLGVAGDPENNEGIAICELTNPSTPDMPEDECEQYLLFKGTYGDELPECPAEPAEPVVP